MRANEIGPTCLCACVCACVCVLHNHFPFMVSSGVSVLFQSFPRELGGAQSKVVKVFVGGAAVIGVVLLIWGPLVVITLCAYAQQG